MKKLALLVLAIGLISGPALAQQFPDPRPLPPVCPQEETCPVDPRPDKECLSDPCGELGPAYYCQVVEFGPHCIGHKGFILSCPKGQTIHVRECCCVQPGPSLCRFPCEPEFASSMDEPPVSKAEGYEPLDCVEERPRCVCDRDKTGAAKTVELFCAEPQ